MLETDNLLIRKFAPADWQDLYEYLSDEEVVKYEPYEVMTVTECQRLALARAASDDFFAVCLKSSGKMIGNLYLAKKLFGTWELGYVFNPLFHGKGYATQSVIALLHYIFENHNAKRIVAMCNPENERSWRLLERIGMRREKYLKQNVFFKRDETGRPLWQDTYQYVLVRSDWEDARVTVKEL